jgi:hypothetical protein
MLMGLRYTLSAAKTLLPRHRHTATAQTFGYHIALQHQLAQVRIIRFAQVFLAFLGAAGTFPASTLRTGKGPFEGCEHS